jgi:hypothetical protein
MSGSGLKRCAVRFELSLPHVPIYNQANPPVRPILVPTRRVFTPFFVVMSTKFRTFGVQLLI